MQHLSCVVFEYFDDDYAALYRTTVMQRQDKTHFTVIKRCLACTRCSLSEVDCDFV